MKSTMVKLMALGLGVCVAGSATAAAPSSMEEFKVRVAYSDLDIDSAAGAKQLYVRMQAASARACDVKSLQAHGSLDRYANAKVCYADTLDKLVAKAGNPRVDALHSS